MSVHPRVAHKRRGTITALPLYYSGHLLKKTSKEKDFKNYYGELRGTTLFLYKDDSQDTYIEKLDLEQLKSMELDPPYERKASSIFTLTLHTEEVQLKMDNPDKGEEWRAYILTVAKKEIPSKLWLLPGQMVQLQEVLAQERRRNPPVPRPPLPHRPGLPHASSVFSSPPSLKTPDMPECFFNVTRQKAEQMLEEKPNYGSIIIRPSTLANNFAVTLRLQMPSGPVNKNYRVTSTNSGFVIELDNAVTVSSLNDVLQYFLEKTDYRLQPYTASQPYDTFIEVAPAPKHVSISSPTPKTILKAQVAPMLRSQCGKEPPPPPAEPEEAEYVVPDDDRPPDHKLKLAQLNGELLQVLKLRREPIYSDTGEEKVVSNH
ncbi:signal-transducing adaptor protein 1-like [Anabas testudineus]|uniref:Signal-transducing adaptor protein 1 n=1 Tax=Anabas testudineus TaxID=64144 RepID=A0A7N6FFN5_ANATE|nr:signal-transducing adaptor protein 1-like [Anabas testudineus]